MNLPVKVVIVGNGGRADLYAGYSLENPDKMRVMGVVDPDPVRLELARKRFCIPDENCFSDYDEFKKIMCENISIAIEKEFVQYLDKNGYTVVYMIYNEYDRLKKKVTITGQDILKYY